jgi:hypothetical protein
VSALRVTAQSLSLNAVGTAFLDEYLHRAPGDERRVRLYEAAALLTSAGTRRPLCSWRKPSVLSPTGCAARSTRQQPSASPARQSASGCDFHHPEPTSRSRGAWSCHHPEPGSHTRAGQATAGRTRLQVGVT